MNGGRPDNPAVIPREASRRWSVGKPPTGMVQCTRGTALPDNDDNAYGCPWGDAIYGGRPDQPVTHALANEGLYTCLTKGNR